MTNTATATKQRVVKLNVIDYQITVHVVVSDGVSSVIDKDYSERYNNTTNPSTILTALQNQIKVDWDNYKAEQVIFNASALNNVVSTIETNLNAYIN